MHLAQNACVEEHRLAGVDTTMRMLLQAALRSRLKASNLRDQVAGVSDAISKGLQNSHEPVFGVGVMEAKAVANDRQGLMSEPLEWKWQHVRVHVLARGRNQLCGGLGQQTKLHLLVIVHSGSILLVDVNLDVEWASGWHGTAEEARNQKILVGYSSDDLTTTLHVLGSSVFLSSWLANGGLWIWVVVDWHQSIHDDVSLGDGGTGFLLSLPSSTASSLAAGCFVADTILDWSLDVFTLGLWVLNHVTDRPSLWAGAASLRMIHGVTDWCIFGSFHLTLNISG